MWAFFKRITFAGIFAIVPIALTFYIIKIIIIFLNQLTAPFLERIQIEIPGLGVLLTILIIFALGIFVTNVLGRKLFSWAEKLISSIPLVKNIYNTIKQITNAFSGAVKTDNYQRVIYIQYPRAELWTISFVTGESIDKSGERLPNEVLHKKRDLLKVYKSQREVLDWFSPWYETIVKVK